MSCNEIYREYYGKKVVWCDVCGLIMVVSDVPSEQKSSIMRNFKAEKGEYT